MSTRPKTLPTDLVCVRCGFRVCTWFSTKTTSGTVWKHNVPGGYLKSCGQRPIPCTREQRDRAVATGRLADIIAHIEKGLTNGA